MTIVATAATTEIPTISDDLSSSGSLCMILIPFDMSRIHTTANTPFTTGVGIHDMTVIARMEVLASNAIRAGASLECAKEILNASTTDEAIDILEKYQILQKTMKEILDRIQFYLNHRSYEQILLGAVIFNNTYGYLGQTADAEKLIKLINAQNDEAQ